MIELEVTLLDGRSRPQGTLFERRYGAAVPAASARPEALAAAWGEAPSQVLAQLESDLGREIVSRR